MLKRVKYIAVTIAPALAVLMFTGCLKEKKVVILSAANTVTAQAVGEIYAQALEAANYRVERRFSLASAPGAGEHALHHALRDGHIDIYAGYTGDETFMFGKEPATNQYSVYDDLKEYFEEEGLTLLEPVPANDAYTLVILSEKALAGDIKTFATLLENSSALKIAVTDAFKNGKEGFGVLEKSYGALPFAEVITVEESDLFAALDDKKADAAVARSNDGRLSDSKYKALRDNFSAFVPQIITPVVKQSYIDDNPALRDALNKVSVTLNDKEAVELNRQLTVMKKEPKEAAKQYLRDVVK
jgi:glycine betaine/choline ABC-type transport system substrate-binding protein